MRKEKTDSLDPTCLFCEIAKHKKPSHSVFEDELSFAFLDTRPLFPGHCLLVPKTHYPTLADLPQEFNGPFFANVKCLAQAVEKALEAEGTFLAINNRVSQSVPHLHVHIVPRRRKDGLKGFFWPRQRYADEKEMTKVENKIRRALKELAQGT